MDSWSISSLFSTPAFKPERTFFNSVVNKLLTWVGMADDIIKNLSESSLDRVEKVK